LSKTRQVESSAAQCPVQAQNAGEQSYDRLFKEPADAYYGRPKEEVIEALKTIAEARRGIKDEPPANEAGQEPQGESRETPAGYTYLGQFIIHDLTRSQIPAKGEAPINRATPCLDLDSVYGGGPMLCPHFFQRPTREKESPHLFYIGRTADALQPGNTDISSNLPLDLPRVGTGGNFGTGSEKSISALIPDNRNDENLVISQIHGLFLRVHNRVADFLYRDRGLTGDESFRRAKDFVQECYRQIVVHDYLKRLLRKEYYEDLAADTPKLIHYDAKPGPIFLEFTFGAARVCHAMSRQHYVVNSRIKREASSLKALLRFSSSRLDAPLPLPADWVINWENFFEMPGAAAPLAARRLTPFLSPVFVDAATSLNDDAPRDTVSFRDLWRCYERNVPTGQACARELADKLPKGEELMTLRSTGIVPQLSLATHQFVEPLTTALEKFGWFQTDTPLTYYLGQEAWLDESHGRTFGRLGSYIMASTFRRALTSWPCSGDAADVKPAAFPYSTPHGISTMPDFIGLLTLPEKSLRQQIEATIPKLTNP
jgi:hypothetical protein